MSKSLTELIRDANREITPADRHSILDLIEQQVARIAELEQQVTMMRDGDTCGRACEGTAYRIEARQAKQRIAELEAQLVKANDAWLTLSQSHPAPASKDAIRREALEEIAAALRKGGDQRAGRSERNHRERGANGHEHRPKHR